jgi:hypothetical protein
MSGDIKVVMRNIWIFLVLCIVLSSVGYASNRQASTPFVPSFGTSIDFFSDYEWFGHNIFHNVTVFNYTGIDIVNRSDYWGDNHYTSANIDNWDTAYEWGNHSEAGYLTEHQSLDNYYNKTSNIDATGYNITADYFFGDGSQLTGLPEPDLTNYYNKTETEELFLLSESPSHSGNKIYWDNGVLVIEG